MKILISGGRKYANEKRMHKVLDQFLEKTNGDLEVVHGAAKGADEIADDWCKANGVTVHPMPANWDKYKRGAGPKRNQEMIDTHMDIACLLAFPDSKSVGTYDMAERAAIAGIPTKMFK